MLNLVNNYRVCLWYSCAYFALFLLDKHATYIHIHNTYMYIYNTYIYYIYIHITHTTCCSRHILCLKFCITVQTTIRWVVGLELGCSKEYAAAIFSILADFVSYEWRLESVKTSSILLLWKFLYCQNPKINRKRLYGCLPDNNQDAHHKLKK